MAGKRSTDFYIGKVGITGTIPAPTGVALETTQGAVKTAVEALAALISSGSLKAVLTAGTAAIGKLAANTTGVLIGQVEIAASQTVALAAGAQVIGHVILDAGAAAIGKLAANSGVIIGAVEVAASQTIALAAGSASIGKLAANTAATYIGDVVLQAGSAAIGKLAANASGVLIGMVEFVMSSTATLSNVSASASSVTVLAANSARLGATIVNDSTSICYLKFGSTASSTSFSYELPGTNANGIPSTLEVPFRHTGIVTGIWVSATGSARVTEFT